MVLPDVPFQLEDGSSHRLLDLTSKSPIVLVFLRHFGCVFCRYQVAQLRPGKDLPIYFVCMESAEDAALFKAKAKSPHHFISDPQRRLYEAFGVRRGKTSELFNLRAVGTGFRAMLAGHAQGRPTSDPTQLSAAVVLGVDGQVAWSHYADGAGDVLSLETIREQLERVNQHKTAVGGKDDPGLVE
jgi:hypothetical protein